VANATRRIGLMTAVTCPIDQAYHPAVTAKGSAILGLVSGNRFTLGSGQENA
jgi:alkanesulfonate monooxygenase SsuD/methylene tetrahydromethanopterin reductase-like flavin-dependent oxidoreductase (luciferase family)